ncbi:MAG: carboxypeptidase regulatory-like domain-containing protein [Acidobacteriota bacterium]
MRSLLLWVCVPAWLLAQGSRGSISGTIKDGSGAVVPGVIITVTNEATGSGLKAESAADGAYLAPQLIPGDYTVSAQAAGFKRTEVKGVKVDVGTAVTQDVTLEVGEITQSVEVRDKSFLVETTSGRVAHTVDVAHVLEMPLSNRDVFALVNLVPGAFQRGGAISIGGGRTQSAAVMVDGVNNTRGGLGVQNIELAPPVDSMEEFKVEANNLSAEYGRTSAGLVNAVTRHGTNEWHGSFYEFLRNDRLDARGWGADEKPPLRRNQFGATLGGPITRNRTFLFYNYDGTRNRTGVVRTRSVGLPEWRRGDFSRATRDDNGLPVPVLIFDPASGAGSFAAPRDTEPFPNNAIPSSRLDPVAVKALTYLPVSNRAANNPNNNAGNWQENTVNSNPIDVHLGRIDHDFTPNTKVYGRYMLTQPDQDLTGYSRGYGPADPDGITVALRRQNLALNASHLFSPTFFLNLSAGVNRVRLTRATGDCCETDYPGLLGLRGVPGKAFPRLNTGGGAAPVDNFGATGSQYRLAAFTNTEWTANLTKVMGQHTLKFGSGATRYNGNELDAQLASGNWGFNGQWTRQIDARGRATSFTGINLADFLLGRLNAANTRINPGNGKRIQYYGGYFQDDWRVTSRLTLNLGIRYDTETPTYEVTGRMSNFDPYAPNPLAGTGDISAGAIGVVTFPNRHGQGKYLWNWDKNNFAPRFGFAWRVFGSSTAVRGGFGVFFGNPYDRATVGVGRLGFDLLYQARTPVPFTLQQGLPGGVLDPVPDSELLPTLGNRGTRFETSTVQFLAPDRVTQYSENFNLTIQHQWKDVLFEAGYIGNLGRKINFPNINLNHIPPELLPRTEIPVRLRRPWTIFTSDQPQIQIIAPNWGLSSYHAFTFKSEKRFRQGIGWLVAYTLSKWIDNVTFTGDDDVTFGDDDNPQNIYNLRAEKSLSTNHVPHRLVFSPIVELPFADGRRGFLGRLLGGWQIATIGTIRSGAPFGVQVLNGPRDILGDQSDGKLLRPNIVADPNLPRSAKGKPASGGVRGIAWMNPEAFAVPALFTYGNVSRTVPGILSPGSVEFDSMVAKNFRIGEQWRAQFRWETFNTFNTPQFELPGNAFGGGGFGVASAGGRRIMQFALKLRF